MESKSGDKGAHAAAVSKQIVSLEIEVDTATLCGWTELIVSVPPGLKGVELHARGLDITRTTAEWMPVAAQATPFSTAQPPPPAAAEPADGGAEEHAAAAAGLLERYARVAREDLLPEVSVRLPPPPPGAPSGAALEARVRVEYEVARPTCGVYFSGGYAVTDSEVRGTSGWMPCMDVPNASVAFQLRLTVAAGLTAVASGALVKQTWADAEQQWKTFHYAVSLPCAPCDLGFAVGPFTAVPGSLPPRPSTAPPPPAITHFAPQHSVLGGDVPHTATFFGLPFVQFADEVLRAPFPLPAMQQVFVPSEVARVGVATSVGLQVVSADLLINPRSIEQSQEARIAISGALARQWFGHFIRPATPDDAWLVEGLAGWLEGQFIKRYIGRTEFAYRRWQQRQTVCALDNGDAPPLAYGYNGPSPWGPLHGTERLDPSPLRALKAQAVVEMLEHRAGEDLFGKHVQSVVEAAASSAGARGAAPAPALAAPERPPQADAQEQPAVVQHSTGVAGEGAGDARSLDATAFLNGLFKEGGFKKEVDLFVARWVLGRGVPKITVGCSVFNKRGNILEGGIQQSGSVAARETAEAVEALAQAQNVGTGVIKVAVREGSGVTVEHPVHIGVAPLVHDVLRVNPEVKKIARKRGRKRKDEEEQLAAIQAAAENAQNPVQYVRLDPGGEWLCSGRVQQSERMLKNQLRDSKDVVAQVEAVRAIAQLRYTEAKPGPLELLREALEDTHLQCRVRMEAANALAALRDDDGRPVGSAVLVDFYKDRYWEAQDGAFAVRPVTFPDVAEYLVAQAVVAAVGSVRVVDGSSEEECLMLVKECIDEYSGAWEAYDDSGLLAALCTALGRVRPSPDEKALADFICVSVLASLERFLRRELVAPSPSHVVGIACLNGMMDLAGNGCCPSAEVADIARYLTDFCFEHDVPHELREAAYRAFSRFLAGLRGWSAAMEFALAQQGTTAGTKVGRAAWEEVAAMAAAAGEGDVPGETLHKAEEVATSGSSDPRVRHLAFIALRRLQRLPPNLFDPLKRAKVREELVVEAAKQKIKLGPAALDGAPSAGAAISEGQPASYGVSAGADAYAHAGADAATAGSPTPSTAQVPVKKLKLVAGSAPPVVAPSTGTPAEVTVPVDVDVVHGEAVSQAGAAAVVEQPASQAAAGAVAGDAAAAAAAAAGAAGSQPIPGSQDAASPSQVRSPGKGMKIKLTSQKSQE